MTEGWHQSAGRIRIGRWHPFGPDWGGGNHLDQPPNWGVAPIGGWHQLVDRVGSAGLGLFGSKCFAGRERVGWLAGWLPVVVLGGSCWSGSPLELASVVGLAVAVGDLRNARGRLRPVRPVVRRHHPRPRAALPAGRSRDSRSWSRTARHHHSLTPLRSDPRNHWGRSARRRGSAHPAGLPSHLVVPRFQLGTRRPARV